MRDFHLVKDLDTLKIYQILLKENIHRLFSKVFEIASQNLFFGRLFYINLF